MAPWLRKGVNMLHRDLSRFDHFLINEIIDLVVINQHDGPVFLCSFHNVGSWV